MRLRRRRAEREPSVIRRGGYQGSRDPGVPTMLMAPQVRQVRGGYRVEGGPPSPSRPPIAPSDAASSARPRR